MPVLEKSTNFVRERIKPSSYFNKKSFRTIKSGNHRIVLGCPIGEYNSRSSKCNVAMETHSILHPIKEFKNSKSTLKKLLVKLGKMKERHKKSISSTRVIDKYIKDTKKLLKNAPSTNGKIMCKNPTLRYLKVIEPGELSIKSPVEIYGRILAIEATKGKNSNFPRLDFRHDFDKKANIYGLEDGSLLITSNNNKPLWKMFEYNKSDIENYVKE